MKTGKKIKSLEFLFSKLQQVLFCVNFFFRFDQTLLNLARMFAAHQCFSEVSVNHLFDDPDSEKKISFGKKSGKSLVF